MLDPVTGPLSRDELKALADAPFGAAVKAIRKHDPFYGLTPGQTIKWEVRATREVIEEGYATVEAETKEDAEVLADKLVEKDFSWDLADEYYGTFNIDDVTPKTARTYDGGLV